MDNTKTKPAPHAPDLHHRDLHHHDHHDHSTCGHDHSHDHHTSAPIRVSKVGRNDACLCGSGKKYKKCCLQHAHG